MNSTSFWDKLPRPIMALAPMDGVSDHPFRYIQKKYGDPMLVYTEFTSVQGMCQANWRVLRDLYYDESQRPIIAQIFGYTPEYFRQTAIALCELGFDGIDINMGCPAKNVAHSGAGAALIRTPQLAQEIILAVKIGIYEWQNGATVSDCPDIVPLLRDQIIERRDQLPARYQQRRHIPVSVKTRIGYDKPVVDEWLPCLLESELAAIGLHGRTLDQSYRGQADWTEIGHAVEIAKGTETLILGNGDVMSLVDAQERVETYGVDGILIGRATYGNPFIFKGVGTEQMQEEYPFLPVTENPIFTIAFEHTHLYEHTFRHYPKYHFLPMRKHLSWYSKGISKRKKLRVALVQTNSAQEAIQVLQEYRRQHSGSAKLHPTEYPSEHFHPA